MLGPRFVTATLAVLMAAAAIGGWLSTRHTSSPSASSVAAARRLATASLQAASAAGSFHYTSSATSNGATQLTIGDAGPHSGRQAITVGGDTFHVIVVDPNAYFQGDVPAMVTNLGLPVTVARAHAGQWVSLVGTDGPFASVYAAVTAPQALADNVSFSADEELSPTTVGGQRVIGLRGPVVPVAGQPATGTATLYVEAGGAHLPVEYVIHGHVASARSSPALSFTIDFSAFGEPVQLSPPAGAVPFGSFAPPGSGPPATGSGAGGPVTV